MVYECPCKDCLPPNRTATCHGECKKYLEWKVIHDAEMQKQYEKRRIEVMVDNDYHEIRKKKSRRKK